MFCKWYKSLFKKEELIFDTVLIPYIEQKNSNGRIYSLRALEKMVSLFHNKKTTVFGELGYPDTFDISLKNISHAILDIWIEEDKRLHGKIRVLDTDKGKILRKNLDNYVFRSRAAGAIHTDNYVEIFQLYTFDAIDKTNDSFIIPQ